MAALEKIQAKTFWPIHIEHWQASGQSQVAYCRQHDLCPQLNSPVPSTASISTCPCVIGRICASYSAFSI
ncbi:IS66 family insertion sequence element accessory protein TnpA [Methyloprofundus sp.]|uniref:IS66 family insertion sequence element accessory protein TnpA n=1 Tax=Methyloprofundus sp. TaxID=2020875 RepID=UPI003D131796